MTRIGFRDTRRARVDPHGVRYPSHSHVEVFRPDHLCPRSCHCACLHLHHCSPVHRRDRARGSWKHSVAKCTLHPKMSFSDPSDQVCVAFRNPPVTSAVHLSPLIETVFRTARRFVHYWTTVASSHSTTVTRSSFDAKALALLLLLHTKEFGISHFSLPHELWCCDDRCFHEHMSSHPPSQKK